MEDYLNGVDLKEKDLKRISKEDSAHFEIIYYKFIVIIFFFFWLGEGGSQRGEWFVYCLGYSLFPYFLSLFYVLGKYSLRQ